MTTIAETIAAMNQIKETLEMHRQHTDNEARALLAAFDDTVKAINDSMAGIRHALVASYKGQIEADRIMVEGTTEPDHEVLPFKSKAAE